MRLLSTNILLQFHLLIVLDSGMGDLGIGGLGISIGTLHHHYDDKNIVISDANNVDNMELHREVGLVCGSRRVPPKTCPPCCPRYWNQQPGPVGRPKVVCLCLYLYMSLLDDPRYLYLSLSLSSLLFLILEPETRLC